MASLCANSPFACGKQLWHESRIPIFEQAISLKDKYQNKNKSNLISRVGMGSDFVNDYFARDILSRCEVQFWTY